MTRHIDENARHLQEGLDLYNAVSDKLDDWIRKRGIEQALQSGKEPGVSPLRMPGGETGSKLSGTQKQLKAMSTNDLLAVQKANRDAISEIRSGGQAISSNARIERRELEAGLRLVNLSLKDRGVTPELKTPNGGIAPARKPGRRR